MGAAKRGNTDAKECRLSCVPLDALFFRDGGDFNESPLDRFAAPALLLLERERFGVAVADAARLRDGGVAAFANAGELRPRGDAA